jgi:hypothetical protein
LYLQEQYHDFNPTDKGPRFLFELERYFKTALCVLRNGGNCKFYARVWTVPSMTRQSLGRPNLNPLSTPPFGGKGAWENCAVQPTARLYANNYKFSADTPGEWIVTQSKETANSWYTVRHDVVNIASFVRHICHRRDFPFYTTAMFRPYLVAPPVPILQVARDTQPTGLGKLNLFTGYRFEYVRRNKAELAQLEEQCEIVLDIIRVVFAQGCDTKYDYLLNFMAHMVQKPHERPEVCLVFQGMQGTGKNSLWEFLGEGILGAGLFYKCMDICDLLAKFNAPQANKMFILLDEVNSYGGGHKAPNRLKSRLASTTQAIERKFMDQEVLDTFFRFCMLTNAEFPVKVDPGGRRHVMFRTGDDFVGDTVFWKKYYAWIRVEENRRAFFDLLSNRANVRHPREGINDKAFQLDRFDLQRRNDAFVVSEFLAHIADGRHTVPENWGGAPEPEDKPDKVMDDCVNGRIGVVTVLPHSGADHDNDEHRERPRGACEADNDERSPLTSGDGIQSIKQVEIKLDNEWFHCKKAWYELFCEWHYNKRMSSLQVAATRLSNWGTVNDFSSAMKDIVKTDYPTVNGS